MSDHYALLRKIVPELPEPHDGYVLVFVGYDYCPYSKRVLAMIDEWSKTYHIPKTKMLFYPINHMQSTQIKNTLHNRTFPLVFLHTLDGQMVHIGGATDLEQLVSSWKHH